MHARRLPGFLAVVALVLAACGGGDGPGATSGTTGEFAEAIRVSAELSRPPAAGETARLSFEVVADAAHAEAEIAVEIPEALEFVSLPEGMRTAGVQPGGAGPVQRAVVRRPLEAGMAQRYSATLRAVAEGTAQIDVRVTSEVAAGVEAGMDSVFITIGRTPAESHFGIDGAGAADTSPVP